MGAFKTTTGLWLMEGKVRNIDKPNVLIVTTKSGKGTFFQIAPELFPEWMIFNVGTTSVSILHEGKEVKVSKFVPEKFDMPAIVVAHYDVFSDSNRNRFETDDQGNIIRIGGEPIPKAWKACDYITDREWDMVWLDEAHRVKNKDTRWTVNLKKLKSPQRHISTGTGIINRPSELWSLLNFLSRKTYPSFNRFKEYFSEIDIWSGYAKEVGIRPEHKEELRDIVFSVGVRRTLDEVMPHIKRPVFVKYDVDLNSIQRKMYDEITNELMTYDRKGLPIHSPNVLSALMRQRQVCVATPEVVEDYYDEVEDKRIQKIKLTEPSSKLDTVMEIIEGLEWDEESKQPLVVFSCFRDPLELLEKRLNDAGISYLHMRQHDNDQERYQKWAVEFPKFQHRVFLSTLQLGGESINLTPARHLVFLDRSWTPKDINQGIGRVRRPGQGGEPVVININARNTTDQRIESVVREKQTWFNELFGKDENDFINKFEQMIAAA
jgi:SNF2 family DNA or RNA helicase